MCKNRSILSFLRRLVFPLFAVATQIIFVQPTQATSENVPSDNEISIAVETGLFLEKGVFPNDVDVNTSHGIVTLSGSVDNILIKNRAVKIAESMRGVCGVIDRITVTPVSRSDEDIRKDILSALMQDPATESYQISVSVKDGVATLSGSIGSYAEAQMTARIAEGVKGTKEVRNDVTIDYRTKRTDPEIAADVKSRLQWDIWINGEVINSSVKGGKVTLTGYVGSAIGKSRAYDDAWVNGVTAVDNSGMKIESWARNYSRRKLKYSDVSESDVKKALLAAFHQDPRVSNFAPGVTVVGGLVLLDGAVGNLKAKISAEQDARNIAGVWGVDNFLNVRPAKKPSDEEMKSQLTAALFWDPMMDGIPIEVSVINSVANLYGTVSSSFQKAEAQDVASRTKGVTAINNHLKVEQEFSINSHDWPHYYPYDWTAVPYLSDEQIKRNIERGLNWSPYVDRDSINVVVDGGVAVLTGTVGTSVGWSEVDTDARNSGAAKVKNKVKVKNNVLLWK